MRRAAGTRLGPYEVIALLGEGGMGEVYCARETQLNRDVAIKVLPDAFAHPLRNDFRAADVSCESPVLESSTLSAVYAPL